jgi:hypothetical protein
MKRAPSIFGAVAVWKIRIYWFALCMRAEMLRVVAQAGKPRECEKTLLLVIKV